MIHCKIRHKATHVNGDLHDPLNVFSLGLMGLSDWWLNLRQDHEHILSNTHYLLSRIPIKDREFAIRSYRYTLYHGLTKSWALVCYPNVGVVDVRVFNSDSEELKRACNALVRDLKRMAPNLSGAIPESIEPNAEIVERLVSARTQYEKRRETILGASEPDVDMTDEDSPSQVTPHGVYDHEQLHRPEGGLEKIDSMIEVDRTTDPSTISQEDTIETSGNKSPRAATNAAIQVTFPGKITVLQPEVPEPAFEGSVIRGTRIGYIFGRRRPESIVSVAALIVGLTILYWSRNHDEAWGRLATAFLATGLVGVASVITSWFTLVTSDSSETIDWQPL